jgi:diguanylate cyclase (GGDEF)-like protein
MKYFKYPRRGIRYRKEIGYIYPSAFAAILIFLAIILDVTFGNYPALEKGLIPLMVAVCGGLYVFLQSMLIAPRLHKYRGTYNWLNAAISGIGLSLLAFFLDGVHQTFYSILLILAVTSISILSGRGPTYLLIFISGITFIFAQLNNITGFLDWAIHIFPIVASIVVTETILRLRKATQDHIRGLETINTFSQQINSSLETDQVLSLLNAALQKALTADSYYVGLVDNSTIRLDLFYDDGEYFSNVEISIENTLAGWVIKNQTQLFLPDLREGTDIVDLQKTTIGKNKTSLSWIGIPMKTVHINGLLALASYRANAFDFSDMELLSNLAQHAALALDNTVHHKQVEEQARLDSLTGAYNHKYFLTALQNHMDRAAVSKQALSLIMLDIDFFKRYNDSFGHQIGDSVLTALCETIRNNIKKEDFVGRWGGEEFAIALPGAKGDEAYQVALRIQNTMRTLVLIDPRHADIPAPTISQGISEFPEEAEDIERFIYLADQRLIKAKERGRNQIEPDPSYWENIRTLKKVPET